jgi:FkbM family methyltransferase
MMERLIDLAKPVVKKFPLVATMYRNTRDRLDIREQPISTPWGFKLAGNSLMASGNFEPTETELVRNILKDVDVLVNVGANVGYYCCHALSMGKQVIAFEPIDRNLRYLYKNLKANNWTETEVFPIALSNQIGILEIYGNNTSASMVQGWAGIPAQDMTLVPASTMDVVLGERLQGKKILVIVDIEGAEQWMLEGATKLLASEPTPIWLVEINSTEHQPQNIRINPNFKSTFQIFFEHGYQAFMANRDLIPVTNERIESILTGTQIIDTHNFIFDAGCLNRTPYFENK